MMGDLTYEIALDDAQVPAENLIGNEGDGMSKAQTWITAGRLYQACRGLGVAQRCIALMGRYAKERVTFGAPLAERQAVQSYSLSEATRWFTTAVRDRLLVMAAPLKDVLARAESWPDWAQEDLAEIAREIDREVKAGSYRATRDELARIDEALAAARRGEVAPEKEVEAVFAKHRR